MIRPIQQQKWLKNTWIKIFVIVHNNSFDFLAFVPLLKRFFFLLAIFLKEEDLEIKKLRKLKTNER